MADIVAYAKALLEKPKEKDKIDSILDQPEVQQAINHPRQISRDHDVPYLAGSSKKGGTTYIDKSIPDKIKIGDKLVDPSKYLNIHEQTEHALMEKGDMPYHKAHDIATDKEKEAVEGDGLNWEQYERVMDGYLKGTEHEKVENPPKDLYLKPYPHIKAHFLAEKAKSTPVRHHHIIILALLGQK